MGDEFEELASLAEDHAKVNAATEEILRKLLEAKKTAEERLADAARGRDRSKEDLKKAQEKHAKVEASLHSARSAAQSLQARTREVFAELQKAADREAEIQTQNERASRDFVGAVERSTTTLRHIMKA
mmetsp:Transcript_26579/g.85215  ORF Transcript_26579/g.85215 Transcript_26579/m.85215 type:complete len:128 (-) Transcript_26579:14-397(-)